MSPAISSKIWPVAAILVCLISFFAGTNTQPQMLVIVQFVTAWGLLILSSWLFITKDPKLFSKRVAVQLLAIASLLYLHSLHLEKTIAMPQQKPKQNTTKATAKPSQQPPFKSFPAIHLCIQTLIFGDLQALPGPLKTQLKMMGIMHLFVISGAHLLFVVFFVKMAFNLSIYLCFLLKPGPWILKTPPFMIFFVVATTGYYCLISGFKLPTLRALIWLFFISLNTAGGYRYALIPSYSAFIYLSITIFPPLSHSLSWHLSLTSSFIITVIAGQTPFPTYASVGAYLFGSFWRLILFSLAMVVILSPLFLYAFNMTSLYGVLFTPIYSLVIGYLILPLLWLLLFSWAVFAHTTILQDFWQNIERLLMIFITHTQRLQLGNQLIWRTPSPIDPIWPFLFYILVFVYLWIFLEQAKKRRAPSDRKNRQGPLKKKVRLLSRLF